MDKAFEKREIEDRRVSIPIIRKVSANPIEAAATPRKTASGRMYSIAPAVLLMRLLHSFGEIILPSTDPVPPTL